jgi:hypothetical protein
MQDGYKPGDPLCCASQGEVDYSLSAVTGSNINIVLDFLWRMFNTDNRPADYLGPSMSVGSIITLSGVAFAVKPFGFEQVDISSSPQTDCDPSLGSL